MSNKDWRIGIDVGGTNTDAVVLDENLNLISAVKSPTTEDVMSGIENAMEAVLAGEGVDRSRIGEPKATANEEREGSRWMVAVMAFICAVR